MSWEGGVGDELGRRCWQRVGQEAGEVLAAIRTDRHSSMVEIRFSRAKRAASQDSRRICDRRIFRQLECACVFGDRLFGYNSWAQLHRLARWKNVGGRSLLVAHRLLGMSS